MIHNFHIDKTRNTLSKVSHILQKMYENRRFHLQKFHFSEDLVSPANNLNSKLENWKCASQFWKIFEDENAGTTMMMTEFLKNVLKRKN